MKTFLFLLFLPIIAFSSVQFDIVDGKQTNMITSTGSSARTDTLYLLGGPDRNDGKFQDDVTGTIPDEEGWTSVDLTRRELVWHVSDYRNGRNSAYCGDELIPSCNEDDPIGGYANSYENYLDWYGTVPDPLATTTADISGLIWYDIEPGYDYTILYLEEGENNFEYHQMWNGKSNDSGESFAIQLTVEPEMYVGENNDQIHFRFRAMSDGVWADNDCLWPTEGHTSLDDVSILFNGVEVSFSDFEEDFCDGFLSIFHMLETFPKSGHCLQILIHAVLITPHNSLSLTMG